MAFFGGERGDWEAALRRWTAAGLLAADDAERIRAWEAERGPIKAGPGLIADAAAYVGFSIIIIGVLVLAFTLDNDDFGSAAAALVGALATFTAALWQIFRTGGVRTAVADAAAGATLLLAAAALLFLLDEVGPPEDAWAAWLLVSLLLLLLASLFLRLAPLAVPMVLAAAAAALLPLTFAVWAGALDAGVWGYRDTGELDGWEWLAVCLVALFSVGVLLLTGRARRLVPPSLTVWARFGASGALAFGVLFLAGAAREPLFDWLPLLSGWALTGWALRRAHAELLPAAAALLLGALAGGLSDVNSASRLALTLAVLASGLQLTVLGLLGPRLSSPLQRHWLLPYWEAALLLGGIIAAGLLAADSAGLGVVGVLWTLAVVFLSILVQHRVGFGLGLLGVYVSGLTLLLSQQDSAEAIAAGTLAFGLIVISGSLIWRRRFRAAPEDSAAEEAAN